MIPTIYKGDDTDFRGAARLSLRIGTEADLSGCTVEFTFLGQTRRFSGDAAAKPLSFAFSASETALFPVGVHRARVRVFDPEGRVKTVDDSVRIRVTDSVADAYGTDGEQQIPVSLVSGFTMPDIPESLDAAASDTVGVFKAKFNDLLALLRSVSALAVAVLLPFAASAANVETAPLDDIPGTAAVVTNVTLAGLATTNDVCNIVTQVVAASNPAFSNAVLAVGLNIDTNSVAVLNGIAETFGGFPIEGTATTVGGLLAALAAAVAWLRKNKVGSFKSVGGASATVDNGVAKLDDFFTESNSLLNGRLAYSRNATGLKDRAFNTLSFDGTEFNLSTALEEVTPTANGQPRDLLIVATATAATTISFTAGTIKGDKPTIDGSGTWLITLTEYASGVWYCRQIKMEDAA